MNRSFCGLSAELGDFLVTPYTLDPGSSRFTVQAFATGWLSGFAHNPTFAVGDYNGIVRFDAEAPRLELELAIDAGSLTLIDRVKDSDREEIESRARREVLETASYRTIRFCSVEAAIARMSTDRYRIHIGGHLALHGASRPHRLEVELIAFDDGLRLRGACPLRMSDYRIRPVTALGGAIRLRDEVRLEFDLGGVPEVSGTGGFPASFG